MQSIDGRCMPSLGGRECSLCRSSRAFAPSTDAKGCRACSQKKAHAVYRWPCMQLLKADHAVIEDRPCSLKLSIAVKQADAG